MTRNRPINEHIAYLLAQANRQVHQQLDEEFRDEGVPVEQWRILKLLAEKKKIKRTTGVKLPLLKRNEVKGKKKK